MKCLICYDISENRIRNKVARYLESLAVRVEYSVFLCDLAPKKLAAVRGKLLMMTVKSENRRLLMVPICADCEKEMWLEGAPVEKEDLCVIA